MKLNTIEEVLSYWREWIDRAQPDMPAIDPEDVKGHIAHVAVSDHFEKWVEHYPSVREIVGMAYDLDSPNFRGVYTEDGKRLWEELKSRVVALDKQLEAGSNR